LRIWANILTSHFNFNLKKNRAGQMHSQYWERNIKNKNRQSITEQVKKKEGPKPEWTTDFVDRSQYKLSESERIQKKAALQSKNR
jgi:hypothetical protein